MIVIIGGSGFYDFLENAEPKTIETPFGEVTYDHDELVNVSVAFIPRHGKGHSILPSNINYRANIFAAHLLEADIILTTNAVGSLRDDLGPGTLVLPDQILDFTSGRDSTFFDGGNIEVTTRLGRTLSGVVHTDVTHPYDPGVRGLIQSTGQKLNIDLHDGGTMTVVNGPRYETPAEIKAFRFMGGDLAGMTSAPEAFLAKELDIPYATIAVVTNYAAGMQSSVSHEEVEEMFGKKIDDLKTLFRTIITTRD